MPRRRRRNHLGCGIVFRAGTHYYLSVVEIFERLLPSYWWTDPTDPIDGPAWTVFAVLLGIAFIAGVTLWLLAPRLAPTHSLHRRLIVRAAKWTVGLATTGLFFLLFRWQHTPFLSKRLWLFLWILSVIGVVAYAVRYRRTTYPDDLEAWNNNERRRRYLPKPSGGGNRGRRRSRRHR
jgi:hypothetical protein